MIDQHAESAIAATLRAAGSVFAEDEAQLLTAAARTPSELTSMVHKRVGGLPLEHILGWTQFCGLRIAVEPGVFVPRRRSEFLAHQAIALVHERDLLVDLCCGSGALAAAVAAAVPGIEVHAVDLDPAAVRCARRNLSSAGAQTYGGDLFEPLPRALRSHVDVLIANAPYVPTDAIELLPPEARIHEARAALDGGPDGLDVLRRVIAEAPAWLAPGGHVLVETSARQAPHLAEIAAQNGLTPRIATDDGAEATVLLASRPS